MIVVGLTGSIGMGKSTAANMLRRLGVPVHDSDAVVHRLMSVGGDAVAAVGNEFAGVVHNGIVDRVELGKRVFVDCMALRKLEAILHPLVQRDRQRFLAHCRRLQNPVVVIDVPLLFETGGDRACDITLVVSAPASIQWARVSNRPGMTRERFDTIVSHQMSDAEKRRRADFVVPTGLGFRVTLRSLARIVRLAKRRTKCQGNAFSHSTRWARS
jgi:dephospho-CoA kinase